MVINNNKKPLLIGLTGGIASGKTTVARILKEQGLMVIEADRIAHQVLIKGEKGYSRVIAEFGCKILNENKEIDRKQLGEIVFNDPQQLKKLEKITHPLIIDRIKQKINQNYRRRVIVIEAPLLYETGLDQFVDQVWVVYVDRETQLTRLKKRDGYCGENAKKRIDFQLSLEKKKELADQVIENTRSKAELKNQVRYLCEIILEKKSF